MLKYCAILFHNLRRCYWRLFKPVTLGASALIFDQTGSVLLVRNTYRVGWHLPGGGVHKGEHFISAAIREVQQETSISCKEADLQLFGLYSNFSEGNFDYVVVYTATGAFDLLNFKPALEIAECKFFKVNALPGNLGAGSARRIAEWQGERSKSLEW